MSEQKRVAIYIDGFNLYHAIADLNDNRLKWLNLVALGRSFLRDQERLVKCQYFTTIVDWNPGKRAKHEAYVRALEAQGAIVTHGTFKQSRRHCSRTGNQCPFREEKQTDVAIGIAMVADAFNDLFDRLILVTADTDQIPAIRMVMDQRPQKLITWAAPPGRMRLARELGALISDRFEMTRGQIGTCRLPKVVRDAQDSIVAQMPADYG